MRNDLRKWDALLLKVSVEMGMAGSARPVEIVIPPGSGLDLCQKLSFNLI